MATNETLHLLNTTLHQLLQHVYTTQDVINLTRSVTVRKEALHFSSILFYIFSS